jgi:hypothetical protein
LSEYLYVTLALQPFYRVKMVEIGGYTLPVVVKSLHLSDIGQRVFLTLWITTQIMYNGAVTLHLFQGTLAHPWAMGTGPEKTHLHFKICDISTKMRQVIHLFQCPELNLMYPIRIATKSVDL